MPILQDDVVATIDGSHTLFSKKYNQFFHNPKDGSLKEALNKHIIPAIEFNKEKKELNILDICFGLGFNSFATIYYILKNSLNIKLNIYSPELDLNLIKSLKDFTYPEEFYEIYDFKNILNSLSNNQNYISNNLTIQINIANARDILRDFQKDKKEFFDIVYQDPFSSEVNKELWTKEYFDDIYTLCKKDSILTSYAIATPIRLSMFEAGFFIYEKIAIKKKITLALKQKKQEFEKYIDMELKQKRNSTAKALYDLHL